MSKRNLIWLAFIAMAVVVVVLVTRNEFRPPRATKANKLAPVAHAHRLIGDFYYRPPDGQTLCNAAIRGMVSQLDEFCSFVPPGEVEMFDHRLLGLRRGAGLRLDISAGEVRIAGVLDGSAAQKANLIFGDRITAVDTHAVEGLSPAQIERLLAGEIDTSVRLTLLGADGQQRFVTLARREFPIESVQGLGRDAQGRWIYRLDASGRIACVRVREFVPDTVRQLARALLQIRQLRALVLDLRDNPGGQLEAAVQMADMFLREGIIMTELDRDGNRRRHAAHPNGTLPDMPIVVLTNSRTASGAEIVAGALKLHGRAVLVGARTRGKGCAQKGYDLPGGAGRINLTVARYYLDSTEPILRRPGSDTWGVDPHVPIALPPGRREQLSQLWAAAEVLPLAGKPPADRPEQRDVAREMLELDAQFAEAVALLKSPHRMKAILRRAAAERAGRTTQPAGRTH